MLFNSLHFIFFLVIVLILYYSIGNNNLKKAVLVIASAYFVFQAGIGSLILLSIVSIFNYLFAIEFHRRKDKKLFYIAVSANVLNLFFYKYYNFFNENLTTVLGFAEISNPLPEWDLLLPLGISFYTFSVIGYLIEIHRKTIEPEKNFLSFVTYIFFFSKLLAGPIERAQNFLPQFKESKPIKWENLSEGVKLIIWGFFQKLVVADRIKIYVDTVYGDLSIYSGITLAFVMFLYTFQIYADFAGYTNLARGVAKLFGYNLMENFERPLLSKSVTEFWRRWHISLSSWVNEYIYTPLSLKYRALGMKGIVLSLFISFFIVGIWHGALWTFVVFGIIQGILLTIEILTLRRRKRMSKKYNKSVINFIGFVITFILISFSLILFRSNTIQESIDFISGLYNSGSFFYGSSAQLIYSLFGVIVVLIYDVFKEFFDKNIFRINSKYYAIRMIPYALLICIIVALGVFDGGQFIYFKY